MLLHLDSGPARGRPPVGLERMLRILFLQQWYGLADGAMEDALYDSQAWRGSAGIDLTVAAVPDETTIVNFRHWLKQHELSQGNGSFLGANEES